MMVVDLDADGALFPPGWHPIDSQPIYIADREVWLLEHEA